MRILHVIHSIDPQHGGPSHAIRAIVRGQVRAGHSVSVLTTDIQVSAPRQTPDAYRQVIRAEEALRECEVCFVSGWGRRKPWRNYGFSPGARAWFRQRFSDPERRPRVVHIHAVFSHITSVAAVESLRAGIPYIVRPAGILDAHCLGTGRAWLKRLFLRFSLRRQLQTASAVQATSSAEARELACWAAADKIRTIPLGVDMPNGDGRSAARRFLARFPQLREKRIVLFLGRIAAKKRPELLVEALGRLRTAVPDLFVVFAGQDDGGAEAVMAATRRHGLEPAVLHTGFLDGEEKAGAFAAADLFALPSFDENFGIAVAEAMAHGLPVLVTPGVAARQYVEASGGGVVVEGTSQAVAEGIRHIVTGDAERMGRNGQRYVEKHLSWQSALDKLEALYRELSTDGDHRPRHPRVSEAELQ